MAGEDLDRSRQGRASHDGGGRKSESGGEQVTTGDVRHRILAIRNALRDRTKQCSLSKRTINQARVEVNDFNHTWSGVCVCWERSKRSRRTSRDVLNSRRPQPSVERWPSG